MNNSLLESNEVAARYVPGSSTIGKPTAKCERKNSYCKSDLVRCAEGTLFGPGNAQLPSGPLQIIDQITDIQELGGNYGKGYAKARIAVQPESWYFQHHFKNDPIFPGWLMLEALWQLTGFHLAWSNLPGSGRLIDSGCSRFHVAVTDQFDALELEIHIKKLIRKPGVVGVACGSIYAGDALVCNTENLKIALIDPTISSTTS